MNNADVKGEDLSAFLSGFLDVLFAFSIVLERRGVLTREEIAAALGEVQRQIAEQEGRQEPARAKVADLMRQAFSLPLAGAQARARLRLIDGGAESRPGTV
jgi:cell division protein FtsB